MTTRPNLVFLLADDLRWNTLGCMGDPLIQTPEIDRLAAEGTLFRNAFVTTSICCASRASIFTGQWSRRHRIEDFATPLSPAQWEKTYPAQLRRAGYRTGFVGKLGVGDAAAVRARASDFDDYEGWPGQGSPNFMEKGRHQTARCGDCALAFLAGQPADQPFCLSVSFTAPHARDGQPREFEPDPRDHSLYANQSIPVPRLAQDDSAFLRLPAAVQRSEGRARWKLRFSSPEQFQRTARDYYRLVSGIDREVGRLRRELEARGLWENTVIVFTSDNGWALGERGLADKWFAYEEDIRVPLIVAGPGVRAGQRVDAPVLNVDLAPTLLALAGCRPPRAMQGKSLLPFLRGRSARGWRTAFFYEHHSVPALIPPVEAVRTERFKYVRWLSEPPIEECYDLQTDPLEEHSDLSLAALPALRAQWERSRKELI